MIYEGISCTAPHWTAKAGRQSRTIFPHQGLQSLFRIEGERRPVIERWNQGLAKAEQDPRMTLASILGARWGKTEEPVN